MVTNTSELLDKEYDKLLLMPYSEQKEMSAQFPVSLLYLYNLIFQDKIQNGFHFQLYFSLLKISCDMHALLGGKGEC